MIPESYLMHYGTKGMKWGISNSKYYKAVGTPAKSQNEMSIKSAKNAVKNYDVLTKKYYNIPRFPIGGALGGAASAAVSMYDMYKNGRNAISQYIDSANIH